LIPQGEAYWPWSASSIGTASKAIGRDIHIATFMLLRIPTPSRLIRVKVASQKSGGIGLYIVAAMMCAALTPHSWARILGGHFWRGSPKYRKQEQPADPIAV
jgi:hypothetical protein